MRIFNLENVGEIIQRINESGINAHLSWYDLEGFDYVIGNNLFGYTRSKKPSNPRDLCAVISVMAYEAALLFPGSNFAKWYEKTNIGDS
jgi:hypothetical protein